MDKILVNFVKERIVLQMSRKLPNGWGYECDSYCKYAQMEISYMFYKHTFDYIGAQMAYYYTT